MRQRTKRPEDGICPAWLAQHPCDRAVEDALNRQILELAVSLSADSGAELHIAHAWNLPYLSLYTHRRAGIPKAVIDGHLRDEKKFHKNWLNRLMRKLAKWVGADALGNVKRRTHLPRGTPGLEIPKLIEKLNADVVIMGTVARTGISGFVMGNTAEQILDKVTCSVLAVKPPGFVSPVRLED